MLATELDLFWVFNRSDNNWLCFVWFVFSISGLLVILKTFRLH